LRLSLSAGGFLQDDLLENQSKISNELLTRQIADLICRLLNERALIAGKKIPNEFELGRIFGVGRGTIREAVKLLVSRNILEIKRGKGTFVCENPGVIDDPFGFRYHEDKRKLVSDLVDIRILLEPEAAALAAVHASVVDIARMRVLAERVDRLAYENNDYSAEDSKLHTMIAKSSQNMVMPNFIPIIRWGIELYNHTMDKFQTEKALRIHTDIIDAIEARDCDSARRAMRVHIEFNRKNVRRFNAET
jgi:DNA-binding FadR family transcriptional regulator